MLQHAQTFVLSILVCQISGIASGQNLKNDNKAVTPQPRILSISDLKGVVLCLDINSEGTKVLLGSDWGGLTIRDTDSGKVLNVLHKNHPIPTQEELNKPIGPPLQLPFEDEFWPVLSVAFEPNGSHVAAAIPMAGAKKGDQQVCKLRIWDTNTGKLLPSPDYDRSSIRALAFETSTGRIHSLDMNRRITSWQVSSGRRLSEFGENQREFSDPFPPYWDTAFGGHGQRAISVMDDKTDEEKVPDPTIKLWDLPSRNYRSIDSRPMAGDTALKSATLSRDGKQGAIATNDGFVHLFDFDSIKPLAHLKVADEPGAMAVKFSPDGRQFIAVDVRGLATIFQLPDGTIKQTAQGPPGQLRALQWLPDKFVLVTGGWKLIPSKFDSTPSTVEPLLIWTFPITKP